MLNFVGGFYLDIMGNSFNREGYPPKSEDPHFFSNLVNKKNQQAESEVEDERFSSTAQGKLAERQESSLDRQQLGFAQNEKGLANTAGQNQNANSKELYSDIYANYDNEEGLQALAQIYYHWFATVSLVVAPQTSSNEEQMFAKSESARHSELSINSILSDKSAANIGKLISGKPFHLSLESALNVSDTFTKTKSKIVAGKEPAIHYRSSSQLFPLKLNEYERTRVSFVNSRQETTLYIRDYFDGLKKRKEWSQSNNFSTHKNTINIYLNGEKIR